MLRRLLTLLIAMLLPLSAFAASQALAQGSTGSEVKALQNRLNMLGLSSGTADGVYGAKTASAVSEAQRLLAAAGYEITVSGSADAETLKLIFDENCKDALTTLRKGSANTRVKELQNRLIELGLLKTSADGTYGSRTEEAVRKFQQRMQIDDADGAVSPALWELLTSDLSKTFAAPVYFNEALPHTLTVEHLYAPAFIMIDAPSGAVLMEQNADERMYPASTTKIVTLLTALRFADINAVVTIPASAADIPADSSFVPVYPGEQMTMRDLLYGLMIRSGNDAANAVGEIIASSVDVFVEAMNSTAEEIGMTQTHFTNPHGYHDINHYTTARDLAIAARYGLTDPQFCEIVTCMRYTMSPTKRRGELVLQNVWEIFDPTSEYYIPNAAGVKSGYTSMAGFCYVGAAQRDGRTLIAVLLGETTRNRAWIDLSRLFEYGFAVAD